jgi:membrane-bound serine protease (ClpP class)
MHVALQVYLILLLAGLFLIGAEIYLPGGVIGILGVLSLLGAVVAGFFAFGTQGGFLSAIAIIVLSGICVIVWIKYFPRTGMGKLLTLSQDGKGFKSAAPGLQDLVNKDGIAQSILRPSGIALIDGQRIDVVAEGNWISNGARVRVVAVEGSRVVVREMADAQPPKDK